MTHTITDERSGAADRLLTRAHSIAPRLEERAVETERRRSLPPESVHELIDAGFARALVPRHFGGDELDWGVAFPAIRIIAGADASHGWCAGLLMEMAHFAGFMHPDAQAELWGDGPDVCIASSVMPVAQFEADGDGFRVSGRSPWTSGVNHGDWSLIAGFVPTAGGPDWSLALIPASQYEIVDTWETIGMRGTGSSTVVTDAVYVPRHRVISMRDLREGDGPGSRFHGSHLYRLPWLSFGPLCFVTPMLGATESAYAAFRDWTRSRLTKSGAAMAELPTVQMKLAKAAADIDAAELMLRRAVEATLDSEPPSLELRARSMRDFGYAGRLLVGAMDAVMEMAGSAGFAESNAIQRAWRDVHFMSTHISMNDSNPIHWARTELGLGLLPNQVQF